jgi:hypothetical protein
MNFFTKLTQRIAFGNEKVQRLAIIMQRAPQTLEDYLFLFPEACPKCGYRNVIDYEESEYLGYRHGMPVISVKTGCECARCQHRWNTFGQEHYASPAEEELINNGSSLPSKTTPRRIYSPYLSRKQSEAIPELPFT